MIHYLLIICLFVLAILFLRLSHLQKYVRRLSKEVDQLTSLNQALKRELVENSGLCQNLSLLPQPAIHEQEVLNQNMESLLNCSDFSTEDWKKLERIVDDTQHHFTHRLRSSYSLLSEDDIHIILLIRLGMDNNKIAALCHILPSSLATRRYRMIKKMGVKVTGNISDFIKDLFNEVGKNVDVYERERK